MLLLFYGLHNLTEQNAYFNDILKKKKKLKNQDRKYLMKSKFLDKCKKEYKKVMENVRSATESYWMNTTIVSFDPIYIRLALCQISWGRWLV